MSLYQELCKKMETIVCEIGDVWRIFRYWMRVSRMIVTFATCVFLTGIRQNISHTNTSVSKAGENFRWKEIRFRGVVFMVDRPVVLWLIAMEYIDIFSPAVYYDSEEAIDSPNFFRADDVGEGPYETEFVQLRNDDVVIDCGANMGIFSILAVKRGAKTVYAFDPQERALNLLHANITANNCDGNIITVPYGLSDKKCTLSFVEENDNIGASRISRDGDTATTTIECTTLDDWVAENNIPRIDFIKADIEGAERDMLHGARNTIRRDHPRLAICTYHLPDDPEVLRDIILSIDPTYHIDQRAKKLYAW